MFREFLGVIFLVIALFMGVIIADSFVGTTDGIRTAEDDVVLLGDSGEYTRIANAEGFNERVQNSRGYAVNLSGTDDSYVQSKDDLELTTDKNWTVSVWASLSPNAAIQDRTLLSLNGRLVISYYPMEGNWSAWYYDEGQTNSYQVNVSAENIQGDLQNVIVRSNGTHLSIYQNNTVGDTKNITAEKITDSPASTANWHGRIDEIRVFDSALDDSNRSALVNNPNAPRKGTNRTVRIMFDEPHQDTQSIFFATGRLKQSNVTFSNGLTGKVMDGKGLINDITGETDYVWDESGPRIYIVEGGELDGAPVAYIEYDFEKAMYNLVRAISDSISLAAIIPMVVILVLIISRLEI